MQLQPRPDDSSEHQQLKRLASEMLWLLWQLAISQEGHQNPQMQILCLETLCQVLNNALPQQAFFLMQAAV